MGRRYADERGERNVREVEGRGWRNRRGGRRSVERGGERRGNVGRREGERRESESERRWRRRDAGGRRLENESRNFGGSGYGARNGGRFEGRKTAGDPGFRSSVRALYAFLKSFHGSMEVEEGREGPPGRLSRLAAQAKKVQPAFTSTRTECRLENNANEWLQNGLMILEEHYQGALRKASREIVDRPGVDWKEAWQLAVKWTRRRYRRMREETVQRAWRLVKALVSKKKPEEEAGEGTGEVPDPEAETGPEPEQGRCREKG